MKLDGQTVLVTGASRGLGRSIALAMAEEGASVVLAARDTAALDTVAGLIEQLGCRALVIPCDIRDATAVRTLADHTLREFGQVDSVVNSAGVGLCGPLIDTTPSEWNNLFATQVAGTFLVIRALLPAMIQRRRGNIINLVAPLDLIERPGWAAYSAAAHAVAALTRTLAQEVRQSGINVNALHPGGFARTALAATLLRADADPPALLDPSTITPAAVALAAQPPRGLSGDIVDAMAWNTDQGLGGGLG